MEVTELMVVRRKGTEKLYLIWLVENNKACLAPWDVDSVSYGAKRCKCSVSGFWAKFELDDGRV